MNENEKRIYDYVRSELKEEYIPLEYRGKINNKFCGHCHHATIAMYYLLGGKNSGYKVKKAVDELSITHYWLESESGNVIDPTSEQYTELSRPLPYKNKISKGVSYRKTKAANEIIAKVSSKIENG